MFHICRNLDDCKRLRDKLFDRLCPQNGGADWMVRLLDEAYLEAVNTFTNPKDSLAMLEKILAYAESHPEFNADFFKSIAAGVQKYGKMTEKQSAAVLNTYTKFKLDKK